MTTHRPGLPLKEIERRGLLAEDGKLGTGDARLPHHLTGEALAGFQLRSGARGAEDRNAGGSQFVGKTVGQWGLWADDDEIGCQLAGRERQGFDAGADVQVGGDASSAVVAGRDPKPGQRRAAADAPSQGVLAGAVPHHEDPHRPDSTLPKGRDRLIRIRTGAIPTRWCPGALR